MSRYFNSFQVRYTCVPPLVTAAYSKHPVCKLTTILCLIQCYLKTSVPAKWHLIPSNGFSEVHECDRRHTDGQTTLYGNMCCNRRN